MKSRTPDVDRDSVSLPPPRCWSVCMHVRPAARRAGLVRTTSPAVGTDPGSPSSSGGRPVTIGALSIGGHGVRCRSDRADRRSRVGSERLRLPCSTRRVPCRCGKDCGHRFQLHRIVGQWSGTNNSAALGIAFPMTVDFEATGPSFVFGRYDLDSKNDVLWGFNIETYGGKDVLAFRNGGYLGGVKRDSRLQLIEYNGAMGYYRFCAVLESGVQVDGCNYIDARYTFTGPDAMTFDVMTQSGKAHVLWHATRVQSHTLGDPFPASAASQGPGTAPWPADAGL